jgi:hypothetical protein
MSNYLVFLDTGERRRKSPLLSNFYKIIVRTRSKTKKVVPISIRNKLGLPEYEENNSTCS